MHGGFIHHSLYHRYWEKMQEVASVIRSIQCIPQTATWISFKTQDSTPAILDFVKFGFNPENYEKKQKAICFVELISFKKKFVSSVYAAKR